MTKKELFNAFEKLFPSWADLAYGYRKIGSKTLAIDFAGGSKVFLYNGPDNWQFGTKLWRKRPERIPKKNEKEIDQNE